MKKLLGFLLIHLFFVSGNSQVLDPVKWTYSVEQSKENTLLLVFTAKIENKWHLYSQQVNENGPIPTTFNFNPSGEYELIGKVQEITRAEEKFDESFQMKLKMFSHHAKFVQKIKNKSTQSFQISGNIEYQICDDKRCMPKENDFTFEISPTPADTVSSEKSKSTLSEVAINGKDTNTQVATIPQIESKAKPAQKIPSTNESSSLWIFFFIAFATGFASIFTPCVYPMIPMTVSFFMQGESKRSAGIIKGLVFGLSIIFIYTMIGVVVMLTRSSADITSIISTHWIPNLIFFLLFIVFAASFFGMFEIVLPGSLANKVDQQAEKGGIIGSFFMALTLVIVSFSCTGPFIGSILVEASQGIAFKPVLGMFGYSLAFAIPFVLFAFSPTLMKKMAKSGTWLNSVKVVFAFILLAFSLKFLSTIDSTYHWNFLSREVYLAVWIVIFAMLGLYLLGKLKFENDSEVSHVGVPRLILSIAAFSFSVYLVPGLFGAPLNEISSLLPPQSSTSFFKSASNTTAPEQNELCATPKYADFLSLPHQLNGYFDYEEGLACAKAKNKPVFLDIKGHACANCKKMEATVWSDPRVLEKLKNNFIIIALYVDDRFTLPENEWNHLGIRWKNKKNTGCKKP